MKQKIALLYGGFSEEREVSLVSGKAIANALQELNYQLILIDPKEYGSFLNTVQEIKKQKSDLVFFGLHGGAGENGQIQALLDLENIPYTGSGYRASAISMDKIISTRLVGLQNIPVPESIEICRNQSINAHHIATTLGLPLIVKPNDSGSSVGITLIEQSHEIHKAIDEAFQYSEKVIIQKYIPGKELTVTILGSASLPVVEITPKTGLYDYTNKYTSGKTNYLVPASISAEETALIQKYALQAFQALNCRVYARVDFRYDGHNFYFLEVNTLPGMTSLSLVPMAAREYGLSFNQLIERIIKLSFEYYEGKDNNKA